MVRIAIVDEQRLVAECLAHVLAEHEGMAVVGVATDGATARTLVRSAAPDVVLLEALVGGESGFELGRALAALCPTAALVFLTGYANPDFVTQALDLGAAGYVVKDAPLEDLVRAIRTAHSGGRSFSPLPRRVAAVLRRHIEPGDSSGEQHMSDREREVFRHLAGGESLSETSKALAVDTETVRTLWKRAREKLGLRSLPRRLMNR